MTSRYSKTTLQNYPQFQTAIDQLHDSAPEYAGALLSVLPRKARAIVETEIENMLNGKEICRGCGEQNGF